MGTWSITDDKTGVSLEVTGKKPPSKDQADALFAKHYQEKGSSVSNKNESASQQTEEAPQEEKSLTDKIFDIPYVGAAIENQMAVPEYLAHIGSSMVAKPVADVAGLSAVAQDMVSGDGGTDAAGFRNEVMSDLTYKPKSESANAFAESNYNPINLFAKAVNSIANFTASFGEDEAGDSALGMVSNAVREGVIQAPMLIGAKYSSPLRKRTKNQALALEKKRNAAIDAARNEAQSVGLVTPAEGGTKAALSGITKSNQGISIKNAETATGLAKKQLGLTLDEPISTVIGGNLDKLKSKYYDAYKNIGSESIGTNIVSLKKSKSPIVDARGRSIESTRPQITANVIEPTPPFRLALNKHLMEAEKMIKEAPKLNKDLKPVVELFKEQLKKDTFNPAVTLENIKSLRADAKAVFSRQSKPKEVKKAAAKMAIANALEGLFEAHLLKIGKPELLVAFREARKKLAQINIIEKVINPVTGVVDIKALANLSKKKNIKLTGSLKTIADFGITFPQAAMSMKGAPAYLTMFDTAVAAASVMAGKPAVAAAEVGVRLVGPKAAAGGLLQKKTPSYKASNTASGLFTGASATSSSQGD